MISIPSYFDQNNNEKLMEGFIFNFLNNHCPWFKIEKQKVSDRRFNLIISDGYLPKILFLCHMDTVKPISDKKIMLAPKVINKKIYGLGAVDMKGGIASLLTALSEIRFTKGVTIVFDCDEEYNFLGIKKFLKKYSFKPQLVICPEPTDLKIVNGCRGIIEVEFCVVGKTAHAANPQLGINAIEKSVKIVELLKRKISKGKNQFLGKTTVNFSAIKGGRFFDEKITIQANAVPDIAWCLLDIRSGEIGLNGKKVIDYIKTIAKSLDVKIINQKINLDYNSYLTDRKELINFEKILIKNKIKVAYKKLDQCGFYEGAFIAKQWNCPTVIFGPSKADTAHTFEEYAEIESLFRLKLIFKELIYKYC